MNISKIIIRDLISRPVVRQENIRAQFENVLADQGKYYINLHNYSRQEDVDRMNREEVLLFLRALVCAGYFYSLTNEQREILTDPYKVLQERVLGVKSGSIQRKFLRNVMRTDSSHRVFHDPDIDEQQGNEEIDNIIADLESREPNEDIETLLNVFDNIGDDDE